MKKEFEDGIEEILKRRVQVEWTKGVERLCKIEFESLKLIPYFLRDSEFGIILDKFSKELGRMPKCIYPEDDDRKLAERIGIFAPFIKILEKCVAKGFVINAIPSE